MLPAMFCLGLFSIGTATSKNAQSVFVTRFFSGLFGSAAVSNVNAALGDIWSREVRGTAVSLYAVCVVGGPTLGPTIGAAILVNPNLGWRWTEYITAIINFAVVALTYFCLPEVYPPVLLKRKAQKLRKETGDDRFFHPHERLKLDFKSIVTKQLSRPLVMLCIEPMVTCIAFYASFVFAILYLTLEVFPIVFTEQRHYTPVIASLPFLGLLIGVCCALAINIGNQPRYIRKSRAAHGKPVPEARLPPLAIGAVLMVVGLFWFGWTAGPSHSWVLPCLAAVFIGAGFNTIFQQCMCIPRVTSSPN
jgi:MFS family permease